MLNNGADLVIGSRMAGARSEMPKVRRLGNIIFATLVSAIGNQHVTDSASGMRVFRREILHQLYPLPDGLNFTPVMSTRAMHEDIRMVEVPIPYSERVGRSKLSVVRDGMRFLNSIVWTALSYNPVRILGASRPGRHRRGRLIAVGLAVARMSGVTQLGTWGVFAVCTALVAAVTGVSLFSLGAMFNYLVSLFQKRPIRQGLFGKPIFKRPLDRPLLVDGRAVIAGRGSRRHCEPDAQFQRLGHVPPVVVAAVAAMLILVGVQLVISWIVMRVLEELSQREVQRCGHGGYKHKSCMKVIKCRCRRYYE